ncbi:caspase family protein [Rhizobium leguminosarum]|uniref:caspase family protein n=1 Tax=Rhizobium leguminosarum TaxID=384 RepID=UPI001F447621|nr:caspase family protein [Rhizobium leguminosarum]UIK20666.1 caspase family protein [Rhizobium leguminosarum]
MRKQQEEMMPLSRWTLSFIFGLSLLVSAAQVVRGQEASPALTAASPPVSQPTIAAAIQQGHSEGILSVAYNDTGKLALTGSGDATTRLWDVSARRVLRVFEADGGSVDAVAFDPRDPHIALTGGSDGAIRLWNITNDALLRTVQLGSGSINSIAFVQDGARVIAGTADGMAVVCDVISGEIQIKFKAHDEGITKIAVSPDGAVVLTASDDHSVKVWDATTLKFVRTFGAHEGPVDAVAFSPDGKLVVSGSGEETTILWDLKTASEVRRLATPSTALAFTPDGQHILAGTPGGRLSYWDVSTEKPLRVVQAHELIVHALAISPDGQTALSGSWGDTDGRDQFAARIWDITTLRRLGELNGHTGVVQQATFSNDGKMILTASEDTTARIWDLTSGKQMRVFQGHRYTVRSAEFSPDGRYVVTGSSDATLKLWDTSSSATEPRTIGEFSNFVTSLAFTSDSRLLLAGSYPGILSDAGDDPLAIYEVPSGKKIRVFGQSGDFVRSVALDGEGKTAISASFRNEDGNPQENNAHVWDVTTGKEIRQLIGHTGEIMAVSMTRDGKFAITGSKDRTARIWDLASGQTLVTLSGDGEVDAVAFSPDGKLVLTGSDNNVSLWQADTGRLITVLRGHQDPITSVAFSPDQKLILTASDDASARLWSLASGAELARLFSFDNDDWTVSTPDGRFDAGNLDTITGVSWVTSDNPLRALSPDTFTRDYYEPSLLPRLLDCKEKDEADPSAHACENAFKPVRDVIALNRIQPDVRLKSYRLDERANLDYVEVQAVGASDPAEPNGKTTTRVYDVRLFRDGQLVGQWPEPDDAASPGDDIEAWRMNSEVASAQSDEPQVHRFRVQLGSKHQGDKVKFTVYGFNEDRVRSEPYTGVFTVHRDIPPATRRAYVIAVGVNSYKAPGLQLAYAASDAVSITKVLQGLNGVEVVPVLLTSDIARNVDGKDVPAIDHARKEDIRDVLALLAGKGEENRQRLRDTIGSVADKLSKVTPDDLVVLAFSGHGYTERGSFFILPSDSGDDLSNHAAMISSEELTAWLRNVDAGEMVMIIDACHSAAGVPEGFKPGPMGDRGLGQLAYDKRMRILAATQAADVAIESGELGQGLLTYALVKEGLSKETDGSLAADANNDGAVSLKEWLTYAEFRVPHLYEDIISGKVQKSKDSNPNPVLLQDTERHAQTPVLFDFTNQTDAGPIIARQ